MTTIALQFSSHHCWCLPDVSTWHAEYLHPDYARLRARTIHCTGRCQVLLTLLPLHSRSTYKIRGQFFALNHLPVLLVITDEEIIWSHNIRPKRCGLVWQETLMGPTLIWIFVNHWLICDSFLIPAECFSNRLRGEFFLQDSNCETVSFTYTRLQRERFTLRPI
jgi:hypothetical protein